MGILSATKQTAQMWVVGRRVRKREQTDPHQFALDHIHDLLDECDNDAEYSMKLGKKLRVALRVSDLDVGVSIMGDAIEKLRGELGLASADQVAKTVQEQWDDTILRLHQKSNRYWVARIGNGLVDRVPRLLVSVLSDGKLTSLDQREEEEAAQLGDFMHVDATGMLIWLRHLYILAGLSRAWCDGSSSPYVNEQLSDIIQ